MKIGFVGLGVMGSGMALNLAKNADVGDYDLLVHDVNEKVLEKFKQEGVQTTDNLMELIDSDYIMMCLPNEEALKDVLLSKGGILNSLNKGQTIVDFSTINYLETKKLYEMCSQRGINFLDCPISGHEKKSIEGTLTIMCGGDEEVFIKVKPILEIVGKHIVYMGKSGSGQLTKMINNSILNICVASFSELMPLGVKLGLNPKHLGDVIMTSTGSSYAAKTLIPKVLNGDFEHGFTLSEAYKDMQHIYDVVINHKIPLPTLNGTMQSYQLALQYGQGNYYKQAMIRFYEDMLEVQVRQ